MYLSKTSSALASVFDRTFHFQLLCGEFFPVYYTEQTKYCFQEDIFVGLCKLGFVDDYVLSSLPLMQASVSLYKLLVKQQKS